MNTARNILGKVGLLFVLLVMVLLIAPSVPAPVSAQTPKPEQQIFLPVVASNGSVQEDDLAVAATSSCNQTCSRLGISLEEGICSPYQCECVGSNMDGNCVWWAYHERPDLNPFQWQEMPSQWDTLAENAVYWVGQIPRVGALMILDWGVDSRGHVAYVTAVDDNPPTDRSWFSVTEMNYCVENGVGINRRYRADAGSNVHFIYAPGVYLCEHANGQGKCHRFADQKDYLRGVNEPIGP